MLAPFFFSAIKIFPCPFEPRPNVGYLFSFRYYYLFYYCTFIIIPGVFVQLFRRRAVYSSLPSARRHTRPSELRDIKPRSDTARRTAARAHVIKKYRRRTAELPELSRWLYGGPYAGSSFISRIITSSAGPSGRARFFISPPPKRPRNVRTARRRCETPLCPPEYTTMLKCEPYRDTKNIAGGQQKCARKRRSDFRASSGENTENPTAAGERWKSYGNSTGARERPGRCSRKIIYLTDADQINVHLI